MKKIIITGALGQDGIILSKILIKKKFKVFGFVKKIKKKKIKNVTYMKCNMYNNNALEKKINTINPDAIVHFASFNPSYVDLKKNKSFYQKNYKVLKNLIHCMVFSKENIKFIFAGSSQMYGNIKKKVNEKQKFLSSNSYSKFRINSHQMIMKMKRKFNIKATTIILFNHDSKYRNKKFVIPRLIKAIRLKKINIIKNIFKENIWCDFSHAEDICNAIYLLLISNYNPDKLILSSGKLTSLNRIIIFLLKKMNLKIYLNNKIKKKKGLFGNNQKAKKILKWKPKKTIFNAALEIMNN